MKQVLIKIQVKLKGIGPLILIVGLFYKKDNADGFQITRLVLIQFWFVGWIYSASIQFSRDVISESLLNIINNISKILFSISM